MTKRKTNIRQVVVATASRPWLVVQGRVIGEDAETITLADARCAVYYSRETRSIVGCATIGPQKGSRVSGACPRIRIQWEAVLDCTPEAVEVWRSEPWS